MCNEIILDEFRSRYVFDQISFIYLLRVYFVISDKAWVHRVESERNFYQYFGAGIDTCEYIILCDDTGADGERDKVLPGKTFDTICVNDILEFQNYCYD